MKKEELVSIIRGIVREEIERALPNALVEILASKSSKQDIVNEMQRRTPAPPRRQAPPPQPPQRKFSSNPILNQVLNETQGGIPPQEDGPAVLAEMPEAPVPGQQVSILEKIKHIPKEQLTENKEIAGVLNVLNRDFRQVVRAVDKKASMVPMPNFKMTPGAFDQDE